MHGAESMHGILSFMSKKQEGEGIYTQRSAYMYRLSLGGYTQAHLLRAYKILHYTDYPGSYFTAV